MFCFVRVNVCACVGAVGGGGRRRSIQEGVPEEAINWAFPLFLLLFLVLLRNVKFCAKRVPDGGVPASYLSFFELISEERDIDVFLWSGILFFLTLNQLLRV